MTRQTRARRPADRPLLRLESLEDRSTPSIFTVITLIGPGAQAAVPALRELANDKDYLIRNYAGQR